MHVLALLAQTRANRDDGVARPCGEGRRITIAS